MKLHRIFGALCAAVLALAPAIAAEQSSYVTPITGPMSMSTFAGTYLNPALRAITSCHNGASAPANGPSGAALPYQCWVDTTANPALYKIYDGASWIALGAINTSTHVWSPYVTGGVSGGVPYFSALNVMGSSAALAANALMVGGGAGVAPSTITAGTDDQLLFGRTSNSPLFRSVTGDVTFATGVAAIGATKVTSAMLNADVFSSAHSWSGQQTFVAPILGTPASGNLSNLTGLPIATGVSGLGGNVAAFLATPSSANLRAALTDEVGTGAAYFIGGALGTPASGVATNLTGTAAGLTAGTVTTNANTTGDVTSVGNATTLAAGNAGNLNSGTLLAARMPALTGDVTTSAGAVATTIAANAVTNAKAAQMAAYTVKGNATGSTANATDISIPALTQKASPVAADKIMIADSAASDALKYATVSSLASAGSVSSLNGQTGALTLFGPPQGRLTLTTGVAVMTSTVSAATTVYYTPSNGNLIPIHDGTNFVPAVFSELSQATTDTTKAPAAVTTNSNYDQCVGLSGGSPALFRSAAWSSNTSRGTGAGTAELELVNGIYVNKVAITNGPAARRCTYVGTFRSNGSSQIDYSVGGSASGGVAGNLSVWNMYNRNLTTATSIDSGAAYNYGSATIRQARASAGNQCSVVVGLTVDSLAMTYSVRVNTAATVNSFGYVSIGEDVTNAVSAPTGLALTVAAVVYPTFQSVPFAKTPLLGYHTYAGVEAGDGATNAAFNGTSDATLALSVWN